MKATDSAWEVAGHADYIPCLSSFIQRDCSFLLRFSDDAFTTGAKEEIMAITVQSFNLKTLLNLYLEYDFDQSATANF